MDWTKAKNILIIALLVTNLIIGAAYLGTIREKEREWEEQARNTASYLAALGVPLEAEIPAKPVKMPVLFVRFEPLDPENVPEEVDYQDIPVESTGGSAAVIPIAPGDNRREVASASYALLKYLAAMDQQGREPSGIKEIGLVYLVDTAGYDEAISEDTAVPAWKLSLADGQAFYVNAYGE